ncbi:MAG: undecaprenyl-diphosphate phosphatase [Oscillospiraceae bacterium]|nr:undecaprenyl-diphosphate phosphatase [Oscillospiraceae bacterium]
MMTFFQAILLGLVQGVAEFLPISSSGHLALIENLFGIQAPEFYDVMLHFGTLVAVFVYYWHYIVDMVLEFFRGCRAIVVPAYREEKTPPARRMVMLVILGTLPLVLILPVKDRIEAFGGSNLFIGIMLLLTGALLFLSDRLSRGRKTERSATVVDALLVGCAQAVATMPGLSRSGTTIAAGMLRGYKREFAVRFSFLLSIPAVLGANLLSLIDVIQEGIEVSQLPVYLAGVVVAGVAGYFSIRLLESLTKKGRFGSFAYYCWMIGIVAILCAIVF